MDLIHPGVYVFFGEDTPEIQEIPGVVGFQPIISERYKDCELLFTGSLNLKRFGPPHKRLYTQGLYNAQNFHEVSSWLYVMRVLPVIENIPIIEYDDDGNCTSNCKYRHPLAGTNVKYHDNRSTADDHTIHINERAVKPVPTFAHAVIGYVTEFDQDTGEPTRVGGFVRYKNPLYKVPENRENLLYLDEEFGEVSRSLIRQIITDPLQLKYNEEREIVTDFCLNLVEQWTEDLIIGSENNGGITDPINGYTSKFWPGFKISNSYYENFKPRSDSFKPLFAIFGIGRGPWYNNIRVSLVPTNDKLETWRFSTYYFDKTRNVFVSVEPEYEVSFDPEGQDQFGESNYIGTIINKLSQYVNVHVNGENLEFARETLEPKNKDKTILQQVLGWTYNYDPETDLRPKTRLYIELRNGTWGVLYTEKGSLDPVIVNNAFKSMYTGEMDPNVLNIYKNDISVTFDIDYTSRIKELIQDFCIKRQDTFGFIDLPKTATPDSAISVRYNELRSLTSWAVGIFGVHSLVYSESEGKDIWVAPSYHMAKLVPLTYKTTGKIGTAVAGLKKGLVQAKKLQYDLTDTDYDRWYLAQLNPIVEKMGYFNVGGNLTAQIFSGPKSNINIVRMMLHITKTIRRFSEFYIFDDILPSTLKNIKTEIESYLDQMKIKEEIRDYIVVVSSTPYEMKRKIIRVNLELIPVYTLEKILLSVNISDK